MKLSAEFIFQANECKVYYLSRHSQIPEVETPYAFRKILQKEQMIQLVRMGEFRAASIMWPSMPEAKEIRKAILYAQIAHARLEMRLDDAQRLAKTSGLTDPYLINITDASNPNTKVLSQYFPNKPELAYMLAEQLSNAVHFFQLANYSIFCLSISIFIERLTDTMLIELAQLLKLNIPNFRHEEEHIITQAALLAYIKEDEREIVDDFEHSTGQELAHASLPIKLVLFKKWTHAWGNTEMAAIARAFVHLNSISNQSPGASIGLDKYRNNLAHRGIGVTYKDLQISFKRSEFTVEKFVSYLTQTFGIDLPYHKYVSAIETVLRK
jgi:hypothetical protein